MAKKLRYLLPVLAAFLFVGLFISPANAGQDCGKLASSLIDTNDKLLSGFDPVLVYEDEDVVCGVSAGICEEYEDIYWGKAPDTPFAIVHCSYEDGSIVYFNAVTHWLLASCGGGGAHVATWGKNVRGPDAKVVCSTL